MPALASIQRISNILPIPNADNIVLAQVLGFQSVVKKTEFAAGDLIVFVMPDTIMPEDPRWEWLGKNKWRVKLIKLKGCFSQGIILPLSIFPEIDPNNVVEGQDVVETVGVLKWEKEPPKDLSAKGFLPNFIKKTDEPNLLGLPHWLDQFRGKECEITLKMDGCLTEDALVQTKGGARTIKDIIESKESVEVLSYNIDTEQLEYKPVTNSSILAKKDNWYEITTNNGAVLKVTGNHLVWLPELGCYRKVEHLTGGDVLFYEKE